MADHLKLKSDGGGALTCALCPKLCRFACPTAQASGDEARHPTGMLSFAVMAEKGTYDAGGEGGEVFYHCTSCYACSVPCEIGQVPVEILHRQRVLHRPPRVARALERVPRWGPKSTGTSGEIGPAPAGAVVWAGCHAAAETPGLAADVARLLERIGAGPATPAPASAGCCGALPWFLGDEDLFRESAGATAAWLASATEVVCLEPPCLHAFQRLHPRAGVGTRPAIHLSEVLVRHEAALGPLLDAAREADGGGPPVAWHDPCLLARSAGVMDPPRRLLQRATGREPVEMVQNRDRTECCGAGGGYAALFPDDAAVVAERALRDHRLDGVEVLVTGSPECARHLSGTRAGLRVVDLSRFLVERLAMA
ncbi:(Fe-S)-binding protein [Myxococcota bacterium]|nr:(Fe-S)-binding protein [Myxococcota bacterium]